MPIYTYSCNKCNKVFELFYNLNNYQKYPECLYCKSKQTSREYVLDAISISVSVKKSDSELKTVGDLANRNRDKLSEDQKLDLHKKHNDYKNESTMKELPKGMSRVKKTKGKKWT